MAAGPVRHAPLGGTFQAAGECNKGLISGSNSPTPPDMHGRPGWPRGAATSDAVLPRWVASNARTGAIPRSGTIRDGSRCSFLAPLRKTQHRMQRIDAGTPVLVIGHRVACIECNWLSFHVRGR